MYIRVEAAEAAVTPFIEPALVPIRSNARVPEYIGLCLTQPSARSVVHPTTEPTTSEAAVPRKPQEKKATATTISAVASQAAPCGYVTYTVDTTEWVKEVHVDISIENIGMTISQTPYRENGSNSDTGSFTVTENGTYTYGINADANSGTGAANFTVTITNIDHTAPIIPNYDLQPTDWVKEGVLLTLEPAVDYQPDMSMGCGLPDNYISYDNGQTWSAELTHFYEDNGDYEIS